MSCAITQGLNLDCRTGYGGIKECYIGEFSAMTLTITAGVVTAIAKETGKRFFKYNLVAHTAEGDEAMTANREFGTNAIKQSLKFPINKLTVSVRNELLLLVQSQLMVVILDNNSVPWLYGADYGMVCGASAKTGKLLGDRNGYELSLESDERYLAPSVESSVFLALETPGT